MKQVWRPRVLASVLLLSMGAAVVGAIQFPSRPALSATPATSVVVGVASAGTGVVTQLPPTASAAPSAWGRATPPVASVPQAVPRALPVSLGPSRAMTAENWAVSAAAPDAAADSAAASVSVRPRFGSPTDRFIFTLTGFAPHERVVISFRPPEEALEFVGIPDDAATVADGEGAGRFELIAAEQWGPTAPGDYTIRFQGEVSGAVQTVTIAFLCGC